MSTLVTFIYNHRFQETGTQGFLTEILVKAELTEAPESLSKGMGQETWGGAGSVSTFL